MSSTPSYEQPAPPLSEDKWRRLLALMSAKKCTPIIGAGASWPTIPLAGQLGEQWALRHGYPLKNSWNLTAVAQFLAVDGYGMLPKNEMQR